MSVWADRIKRFGRLARRGVFGSLSVWLPAALVVFLIAGALGLAFSLPTGTFQYCSDMLVRCIKDIPETAGGFERIRATGACSYHTARCDLETLHYSLMREEPAFVPDPTDERQEEVFKRLLSDEHQAKRTEELKQIEAQAEKDGTSEDEDLNELMLRLRREREAFEAEQRRFKKMLFETMTNGEESGNKSDELTRQKEK
ncbi:unknown [Acetobacter sp. CAG:977]|nr:unknown [Acetobacter sp. CAG:977]